MISLHSSVLTGMAVAFATTFDDNIYLTLFFGKVNRTFRPRNVVVGEYIGFTVLVGVSLVGFVVGLNISPVWVGLLGILPIAIGISNLIRREQEDSIQTVSPALGLPTATRGSIRRTQPSVWATLRDPQTYKVSAVTISNGGNNVGIYIPLFASSTLPHLSVILGVCYTAIGTWLFLSYNLTRQPAIAFVMARYARRVFPFILIWIGASILYKSESYQLFF